MEREGPLPCCCWLGSPLTSVFTKAVGCWLPLSLLLVPFVLDLTDVGLPCVSSWADFDA